MVFRRKGQGQDSKELLSWEIIVLFHFQAQEGSRRICLAFQLQASLCHPACVSPRSELCPRILDLALSAAITVRQPVSWGGGGREEARFEGFLCSFPCDT